VKLIGLVFIMTLFYSGTALLAQAQRPGAGKKGEPRATKPLQTFNELHF
jgi:hypothetical protein